MRPPLFAILAAAAALSACASAAGPPAARATASTPRLSPAAQRGHDFAYQRCGGCHNVGLDDGGPTEGPAFRTLSMRYNPISLERRFAEVSAHGYDRMPPVNFTRSEAEDLIAYFYALNAR
jgi:mono/diheme cytochrome c family protein